MTQLDELITSVIDLRIDDVTPDVLDQVKRSFIRVFGAWFAASEGSSDYAAIVAASAGVAGRTVFAVGAGKLQLPWAAFVNGYTSLSGHQVDFHREAWVSPTGPVASTLCALVQDSPVSGSDFLLAMAVGIEVALRVGLALGSSHRARGWYQTATAGLFGAVAAGAKLRSFSVLEFRNAMGLAASLATGTEEAQELGGLQLALGRASYNAAMAVLLAERGFTSNANSFAGKGGFLEIASAEAKLDLLRFPTGTEWEILNLVNAPSPSDDPVSETPSDCNGVDENSVFLSHAQQRITGMQAEMLLRELGQLETVDNASGLVESALRGWTFEFNASKLP